MNNDRYEYDFKIRKLYEQKSVIEENKNIHSATYACSYQYPGSLANITCRTRITVVYEYDYYVIVNGGTIEKWTDKGWQTIEEFFDTNQKFTSSDDVINHMLNMFKSFTLGISTFDEIVTDDEPVNPGPNKQSKKDAPKRILSFKNQNKDKSDIYKGIFKDEISDAKKLNKYKDLVKDIKNDDSDSDSDSDSDDDDDDIDWI